MCDIVRNNDDYKDEPHEMFNDKIVCEQSSVAFLEENMNDIIVTITKELKLCEECNVSLKNSEFPIFARQIVCRVNKLLATRSHWRDILKVLIAHFDNWVININWHECIEHHDNIFQVAVRVICIKTLTWWCLKQNTLINCASDDLNDDLLCIEDIMRIRKERETYKLERRNRKEILNEYRRKVHKKM